MNKIKTVIVDDEPLYAWEMEEMLTSQSDFEVVGVFNEANTALTFINSQSEIDMLT